MGLSGTQTLSISKAFYAFYNELVQQDCAHTRVNLGKRSCFCPDCGYKVKLLWAQVKCRGCNSRRVPKKSFDGSVEALHKYCRYCGASDVRLVKKEKIEGHELVYSVALKEVDYAEEKPADKKAGSKKKQSKKAPDTQPDFIRLYNTRFNPRPTDVHEGEVIRKRFA